MGKSSFSIQIFLIYFGDSLNTFSLKTIWDSRIELESLGFSFIKIAPIYTLLLQESEFGLSLIEDQSQQWQNSPLLS